MHTAATILKKYKWTSEEKPRAEASKERAELAAEVKSLRDWLKQCKEGDAHKPELDAALSLLIQVKLSGTSSSTLRTSFCVEGYVQTIC